MRAPPHATISLTPTPKLDYERIFSILKSAGYRDYVAIEYEYTDPPMQAIPRFAKKLLALRDRIAR